MNTITDSIVRKKMCESILRLHAVDIIGVPDAGGLVCRQSGSVFLAFRHPAGFLRFLLLEDLQGRDTRRQGRSNSRRSV